MKKLFRRITRRGRERPSDAAAVPQERPGEALPANYQATEHTIPGPRPSPEMADAPQDIAGADPTPASQSTEPLAPKPPPDLPLFFMLSHVEDDGPVRLDGVKLGVCEVMGLEIDEPKLGAFAGALNACDFPFQLLIRQHPPRLDGLRAKLRQSQPESLPPQTRAAAESLGRLLIDLEARDGILDRRFYAICEFAKS